MILNLSYFLCIILHLIVLVHMNLIFCSSFFLFLFSFTWFCAYLVLGLVGLYRDGVPQHGIMIELDCPWEF